MKTPKIVFDCRKCGGKGVLQHAEDGDGLYRVVCKKCGETAEGWHFPNAAIHTWNYRNNPKRSASTGALVEKKSRETYVIELANGKYLSYYSIESAYCYTTHLFASERERRETILIANGEDTSNLNDDFEFNVREFRSPEEAYKYIRERSGGKLEDFFGWCAELGGTKDKAFPRVVKMRLTSMAETTPEYPTVITKGIVQYGK